MFWIIRFGLCRLSLFGINATEPLFSILCIFKPFGRLLFHYSLTRPQKYKTEERIEVEKASAAVRDQLLRGLRGERAMLEKKAEGMKIQYEKEKCQLRALVESEKQKSLESRKSEKETIAELHSRINRLAVELDNERAHSARAGHQLQSLTQNINVRSMNALLV